MTPLAAQSRWELLIGMIRAGADPQREYEVFHGDVSTAYAYVRALRAGTIPNRRNGDRGRLDTTGIVFRCEVTGSRPRRRGRTLARWAGTQMELTV